MNDLLRKLEAMKLSGKKVVSIDYVENVLRQQEKAQKLPIRQSEKEIRWKFAGE